MRKFCKVWSTLTVFPKLIKDLSWLPKYFYAKTNAKESLTRFPIKLRSAFTDIVRLAREAIAYDIADLSREQRASLEDGPSRLFSDDISKDSSGENLQLSPQTLTKRAMYGKTLVKK